MDKNQRKINIYYIFIIILLVILIGVMTFLTFYTNEKFIELKSNDEIRITGTVFSNALGDAWIDVTKLELIKKTPDKKDGV